MAYTGLYDDVSYITILKLSCFHHSQKGKNNKPGASVIKPFTAVIYCLFKIIPSFCVIKLYYLGNYQGMAGALL